MRKGYKSVVGLLSVMLLVLGMAFFDQTNAQIISGDLVGTVLDKTGAVVPGARVEVTNADTGVKYETVANENGEYRFNNFRWVHTMLRVRRQTSLRRLSTGFASS